MATFEITPANSLLTTGNSVHAFTEPTHARPDHSVPGRGADAPLIRDLSHCHLERGPPR